MSGFIKLHRSIVKWEWYDDTNTFRLFLHLLLNANYQDERWRGIVIKRGQRLTSQVKIAKEIGLTYQQLRTAQNKLKQTGEITSKATGNYTIYTIVNYEKYQSQEKEDNEQSTNESTIQQPSSNDAVTTNKEGKEYNNNNYARELLEKIDEVLSPAIITNTSRLHVWLEAGASADLILETIRRVAAKARDPSRITTLNYFDGAISDAIADFNKPMEQRHETPARHYANGTSKSERAAAAIREATNAFVAE
ncbi:MAG: hypothetical protein MRY32_06610 [Rickettsiales bacterium]|nr:hypothetical protein [Rickettsiales bacterium]